MSRSIPRPGTEVLSCVQSVAASIAVAVCVRELRGYRCNSRRKQKNKGTKFPPLLTGLNSPNEASPGQGRQVIILNASPQKNYLAGAAFTLDQVRNKKASGSGAWKALHLPCSRALGGESGDYKGQSPLVLQKGSLPEGPKQIYLVR